MAKKTHSKVTRLAKVRAAERRAREAADLERRVADEITAFRIDDAESHMEELGGE